VESNTNISILLLGKRLVFCLLVSNMVIWIANQRVSVTVVDLFNDEMKDELWNL